MPRFAANLSLLFTEMPFTERFGAAGEAGFSAVECQFPYAWEASGLAAKLRRHGLEQVLFNLPAGDWGAGDRGIAGDPRRTEEFRRGVARALTYADALNCRRLNCLAGLRLPEVPESTQWQTLVDNVGWAAGELGREGITLCLEAINSRVDVPGFLLDSSASVVMLMEQVGADNLRLQYDLYHMQIMEGDLIRSLERLLPVIGHIQFADNPGRHQPGTGEINFPGIFAALDRLGYSGWVGAEYNSLGTTMDGLGWLADYRAMATDRRD